MKSKFLKFFKNYDWVLLATVVFLCSLGLAVLYSTTYNFSLQAEAVRQTVFMGIGLVGLIILSRIDYRIFQSYSGILYLFVIGMLIAVQLLGKTANNAQRWIDLGFFQLQPSLLSQLLMAIILAKYFSDRYEDMHRLKTILLSALYVSIPTILVLMEPNLGTAFVFVFMWGVLLLVSNAKKIYLAFFAGAGLAALPLFWSVMKQYQRQRVLTFLNPSADPQGAGWNVTQAMIAIGSGQIFGQGLGRGSQSQLNFIPEKHTDFIFASLAEEMGLLGVFFLIGLFAILFFRGIRIAVLARDFFGTYLAIGILAMFFVHVFVNIGMNMGIMPVTGIPLPFISYGGTPVLVDLFAVGILMSVYSRYKKIDF